MNELVNEIIGNNSRRFLDIKKLSSSGAIMGDVSPAKLKIPVSRKLTNHIDQLYDMLSHDPIANESLLKQVDRFKRDPEFKKEVLNLVVNECWASYQADTGADISIQDGKAATFTPTP
jgi:hypothetical protein